VSAGYLGAQSARQWLDHLARQPFFASVTLVILPAAAR